MGKLSTDAQVILATYFSNCPKAVLTLGNEHSRMTGRSRAAMSELIMAGIVSASKTDDGRAESLTYALTARGARMNHAKSMKWMAGHGRWPFVQPIGGEQ